MVKLINVIVVILLMFISTTPSTNYVVSGKVMDKNTSELLVGAKIQMGDVITYTNMDGEFTIESNSNVLETNLISYNDTILKLDKTNNNLNLELIQVY